MIIHLEYDIEIKNSKFCSTRLDDILKLTKQTINEAMSNVAQGSSEHELETFGETVHNAKFVGYIRVKQEDN